MTGVKQQKEAEKDKYEVQLTTARSDFQEMCDRMKADNMALQGRLKSLEDYRLHKQEMEAKLEEKESRITSQDKEYSDRLNELEKKNLLDRDRSVVGQSLCDKRKGYDGNADVCEVLHRVRWVKLRICHGPLSCCTLLCSSPLLLSFTCSIGVILPTPLAVRRLRKDMDAKVRSVAEEFRKVSDQQIADTTRRTICENVAISQQLDRMSSKTVRLLEENDALQQREKELRRHIEVLEANEKVIIRKNKSNQKVRTTVLSASPVPIKSMSTMANVRALIIIFTSESNYVV